MRLLFCPLLIRIAILLCDILIDTATFQQHTMHTFGDNNIWAEDNFHFIQYIL